jgi:uncharacterized protein
MSTTLNNGEWQAEPQFTDYRSEWLSEILIERALWTPDALVQRLGPVVIAAPNYVWLRFWLVSNDLLVEKYFDDTGQAVGYYAPICVSLQRKAGKLRMKLLTLAVWIEPDGRVTVLNEAEFDKLVSQGEVTPVEAEQAEQRIRELTTAIGQKRFPPAIVRNFEIVQK